MGAGASTKTADAIEAELKKPVDGSDIETAEAGKAEVIRLRALIADGLAADEASAPKHFVVCVDGSDDSEVGFQNAHSLMKGGDKITLLHYADASKEYLPENMKPKAIQEKFGNILLSSLPKDRYKVDIQQRPADKSATWFKDAVCEYVKDCKADYLVVGFCGRKGPKEDPTVLGSNGDVALRQSGCSSIITKKQWGAPKEKTGRTFAVALDGSARAEGALADCRRLAGEGDKILVLHVHDHRIDGSLDADFQHAAIEKKYSALPYVTDFVTVDKNADEESKESIPDLLAEWINMNGPDFFVLGADGARMQTESGGGGAVTQLGSTCEQVVKKAKCQLVVSWPR